jgi:hypothetical protein
MEMPLHPHKGGVSVSVGTGVRDAVSVGVYSVVRVKEGVEVGVALGTAVKVAVQVIVAVGVGVRVGIGVGTGFFNWNRSVNSAFPPCREKTVKRNVTQPSSIPDTSHSANLPVAETGVEEE